MLRKLITLAAIMTATPALAEPIFDRIDPEMTKQEIIAAYPERKWDGSYLDIKIDPELSSTTFWIDYNKDNDDKMKRTFKGIHADKTVGSPIMKAMLIKRYGTDYTEHSVTYIQIVGAGSLGWTSLGVTDEVMMWKKDDITITFVWNTSISSWKLFITKAEKIPDVKPTF